MFKRTMLLVTAIILALLLPASVMFAPQGQIT